MYRTRFMILVLRCFIALAIRMEEQPSILIGDCWLLIQDLKQHGGE